MNKSSVNAVLGFIAGAAVGTALGIMFAPDKGTETRKKIKDQARKATDDMKGSLSHKIEELNEFLSGFVSETKSKIADLEKKTKQEVKDKLTK